MLEIKNEGRIAWLLLSNPPVNALNHHTLQALIHALKHCADDEETRVVVLGGQGRHFCAGADLREQQKAWATGGVGAADGGAALYRALLDFPKPLIGMAHGAVAGAGLSIMACCDLAVAAHGTRISLPEINVGVLGGISHARAVLGKSLVHYLALTGLPVEAEQLERGGLFLDVVPLAQLRERVATIAQSIADKHPSAAQFTKRCMRAVEGLQPYDGYVQESAISNELRDTGVTAELVTRFLTR